MLKFINAVIILLFLAGAVLFALSSAKGPEQAGGEGGAGASRAGMLAAALPAQIEGWKSKERPLGDTPEVERAARKALRASDYFSREYFSEDGSRRFGVYVAFWEKGADGTANASSHTPDRCWVENGWKNRLDKSDSRRLVGPADGVPIMPANYRFMTFDSRGVSAHVLFWFVRGGKLFDYGAADTYLRNPLDYLKNAFAASFTKVPELYFVRIESATPFEELQKDAGFMKMLGVLGKLAIGERQGGAPDSETPGGKR